MDIICLYWVIGKRNLIAATIYGTLRACRIRPKRTPGNLSDNVTTPGRPSAILVHYSVSSARFCERDGGKPPDLLLSFPTSAFDPKATLMHAPFVSTIASW